MTTTADKPNQIHQGRNVKRFREMLGLKQEALLRHEVARF